MEKDAKIYVAGHRGLVGSALVRRLEGGGWRNLLTRTRAETDLTDRQAVARLLEAERPDYVFDAAARVGGIYANNAYPADFIRDNLLIQLNLVEAAYRAGVKKFLFLGSSCIYPKLAPQPMQEAHLLTGPLEPTNEWYAIAKISGIKLCQTYRKQYGFNAISPMPTNLYGPGDNFNLETSHVLPALIRKFHEAKIAGSPHVTVWGSGTPKREFLYVDDLADACVHLMEHYDEGEIINVGTGEEVSIAELAGMVKDAVGFEGGIEYDRSKPDGTPRKLLDVSRLAATGWRHRTGLREGIEKTYRWFLEHQQDFRG
ncbi:MAG TPA: GDP-L-fucose synthase [Woeseiaceae bacterium]|nr:GDP-L-fucose synthase [Woeseiaceae bacterium]